MGYNQEQYLAKHKVARHRKRKSQAHHHKAYSTQREANRRVEFHDWNKSKKIKARVSGQVGYTGTCDSLHDEAVGRGSQLLDEVA